MNIIIADDIPGMRRLFSEIIGLRFPNFKIDCVENGQDLINKVREKDYDFVITDNSMPVRNGFTRVDGIEAISEIRKNNKTVPICMISSSTIEKLAFDSGANYFIDKKDASELLIPMLDQYVK